MTCRKVAPIVIESFPRPSLMTPNFHTLSYLEQVIRLFLRSTMDSGENLRSVEVYWAITAMVEMLGYARSILSPPDVSSMLFHALVDSACCISDVCIGGIRITTTMQFINASSARRFVLIFPAEEMLQRHTGL